jgi:endoglucanase
MAKKKRTHYKYVSARTIPIIVTVALVAILGTYVMTRSNFAASVEPGTEKTDIDRDGVVGIKDLSALLSQFGKQFTNFTNATDINGDGKIDIRDLSVLLAQYGRTAPPATTSPVATTNLYVSTYTNVYNYVYGSSMASWRQSHPTETALLKKIADQPHATWLGYSTDDMVLTRTLAATTANKTTPVITLYAIPYRDNGQYAAAGGGKASAAAYRAWIDWIASKVGSNPAIFIVEPDGLAMSIGDKAATATTPARTSAEIMAERYSLIAYASAKLGALPNSKVYLDIGNSGWGHTPEKMAGRAKLGGIATADGFSTNVSNFRYTSDEVAWGNKLSALVGGKHFVIDTSRNGNGPRPKPADGSTPPGEYYWCNPPGRALGARPTLNTGIPNVDAFLWIKGPGGIDGPCNDAPTDTNFWVEYAVGLARNAAW